MISAAEFAREVVAEFARYKRLATEKANHPLMKTIPEERIESENEAVLWSDAREIVRDLAAKHGIELATPAGEPTKGAT